MSTMTESNRTDDLSATLDNLVQAHQEWQASDDKNLSREFCEAIEAAIEVWNAGDVPGSLRTLAPRMEALEKHWTQWLMVTDSGDGEIPAPDSGHPLWKTMSLLLLEKREAEYHATEPIKYVEPLAMLKEQKVPDRQICRMYRAHWEPNATDGPGLWDNARGQPMLARLFKELKDPGSILGEARDEFIPYETVERLEKEKVQRIAADRAASQVRARRAKANAPDPTPLADLVAEGVSGSQIARMKLTTIEDIERQCKEQALPIPERTYGTIKQGDGKFDAEPTDASERIANARANAFQNRQRLAEEKATLPTPKDKSIADQFGGDIDDDEPIDSPSDGGSDLNEGQDSPQVSALERQVAKEMDTTTKPKEIAASLGRDDWQNIRNIIGRLKGDPARMEAAKRQ